MVFEPQQQPCVALAEVAKLEGRVHELEKKVIELKASNELIVKTSEKRFHTILGLMGVLLTLILIF